GSSRTRYTRRAENSISAAASPPAWTSGSDGPSLRTATGGADTGPSIPGRFNRPGVFVATASLLTAERSHATEVCHKVELPARCDAPSPSRTSGGREEPEHRVAEGARVVPGDLGVARDHLVDASRHVGLRLRGDRGRDRVAVGAEEERRGAHLR